MAPVTPSPHRFLAGQPGRQTSPLKDARPPSAVRPLANSQAAQRPVPLPPSTLSQFAATPRFAAGKPTARPSRLPSPSKPALISALRAAARSGEDVEDASLEGGDEDDEMLDREQAQALPTTEDDDTAGHGSASKLPFSPKRRRSGVTDVPNECESDMAISPVRPTFHHPHTPASHFRTSVPHFLHPPNSIASTIDQPEAQNRPPFLRPSTAPTEPTEPLPEAFSPHRRGQKFVTGGMAATVQQWVVETGQAAVQSRGGHAYIRVEDFVVKVKVDDVDGDGPYFLKAKTADGERLYVLLASSSGAAGQKATSVMAGNIVGIRAPTWEAEVQGRSWRVGVDWKLI